MSRNWRKACSRLWAWISQGRVEHEALQIASGATKLRKRGKTGGARLIYLIWYHGHVSALTLKVLILREQAGTQVWVGAERAMRIRGSQCIHVSRRLSILLNGRWCISATNACKLYICRPLAVFVTVHGDSWLVRNSCPCPNAFHHILCLIDCTSSVIQDSNLSRGSFVS